MYLYFFDLDDTICHTQSVVDSLSVKHNIHLKDFSNKDDFYVAIDLKIKEEIGYNNIPLIPNNTVKLLQYLLRDNKDSVYYITARSSSLREESKQWLAKHDLWLNDERLIMDAFQQKGQLISNILKEKGSFAFLFDDLLENHEEVAKYKNIISCLPS
ncbi:hypothetical protein HAV_00682 [Candidatus Hepatincola sp. Av]